MNHARMVRLSKRMSRVLRHDPGGAGLVLDEAGWVPVEEFIHALRIRRAEFDAVVADNDKRRFAVETGSDGVERVRASQGHSIPIDLRLAPRTPPELLYHGTSSHVIDSIMTAGLNRGRRHHVHLSADIATACRVGARRGGSIVVFTVEAARMAGDGHPFYRSANGVWLTERVPAVYLRPPSEPHGHADVSLVRP